MSLATLTSCLTNAAKPSAATVQYGAMPYRIADGEIAFLLVTSRRTGRWIFPKGSPIDGLSPSDTAAQEAYEEAGVRGTVDAKPIGTYRTIKQRLRRIQVDVQIYPLHVTEELDEWPEMEQRQRNWVPLAEAQRRLTDQGAISLAEKLSTRIFDTA